MIAGVGRGEFGELAVVPLELAGIHDDAANARAVAADVFRGRRGNDVRAEIKRTDQADADSVVNHQRDAVVMGNLGQRLEVRDIQLWIADGLGVKGRGFRRDGFAERLGSREFTNFTVRPSLGSV